MESIISVSNLGKEYKVSHQSKGYVALRDVLTGLYKVPIRRLLGRKQSKEKFHALRDISFTVNKGEAIGIIGANGAGKSTLLKILSKITPPSSGEIRMKGKVSSLLEVGTGFHPELTGRENIFLNGSILGMSRKEITKKFDEIVKFSGVEYFLDTPVKRYSSGMQVRLAFAVAAHLEPDILIVDEVLAVGDAAFQRKSFSKMEQSLKEKDRTILLVSHNMNLVQKLCKRCILLEKGEIKMIGKTSEVISEYLENYSSQQSYVKIPQKNLEKKPIQIQEISVFNHKGKLSHQLDVNKPFSVEVSYFCKENIKNSYVGVGIIDLSNNLMLVDTLDIDSNIELYKFRKKGLAKATFRFPAGRFNEINTKLFIHAGTFPTSRTSVHRIDGKISISFIDFSSFATKSLTGKRDGRFLLSIPSTVESFKK